MKIGSMLKFQYVRLQAAVIPGWNPKQSCWQTVEWYKEKKIKKLKTHPPQSHYLPVEAFDCHRMDII